MDTPGSSGIAELESIFVSNPYGIIGRELEVKAAVKGNSDGLDLQFWADTPESTKSSPK